MKFILPIGICALALIGVPALSQDMHKEGPPSSRLIRQIARTAPQGTFYLTRDQQSEVVDYSRNRDLSICVRREDAANPVFGAESNIPLSVNWTRAGSDLHRQATVYPGNCLAVDAAHMTIRPARSLPAGRMLVGRVRTNPERYRMAGSYDNWNSSLDNRGYDEQFPRAE